MADFLLELLSEEIPARMQEKAGSDLARLMQAELARAGLTAAAAETYATPRRLALILRDLAEATAPAREETKGPRASAPPQALEGFLRKTGLAREALEERDGVLFAVVERPGRATAEVLAEAIPAVVRGFPWPKSMRWGAGALRWVRPLHGIVALFGEEIVDCAVDGIVAGAATAGHRFHHPGPITIGSAADYLAKLRACHVIADPAERRAIIEEGACALAEARGLRVVPDVGLVAENAGLTEWPVPLIGDFDPAFLQVPREVIQLTMRTNQKYFACIDADGALAPAFVCTANIEARDGGAGIVAGNRKVLAARLADARFFWEQDLKVPLADQAAKLDRIVFHEKLGTLADKVERVAKLARWLVEEGIVGAPAAPRASSTPFASGEVEGRAASAAPDARVSIPPGTDGDARAGLAAMAKQAARLCKADLVTGMVGEFPELQGVMGGYYARAQDYPDAVADAIRDHYKPVGQGDEVPTAPVTVAVSLADKLDTLACFYFEEMPPTGSKDPFALRRAALSVIALITSGALRLPLALAILNVLAPYVGKKIGAEESRKIVALLQATADAGFKADEAAFERAKAVAIANRTSADAERIYFGNPASRTIDELLDFFADRLKVQQREAGVRHDLIDAVFALGGEDDLVRLLARVKALQAFVGGEDGANLLAGYKRAANILRKEGWDAPSPRLRGEEEPRAIGDESAASESPSPDPLPVGGERALEPAEAALGAALDAAEPAAAAAVAGERFEDAMAALASLRAPIDAFFEQVTVNDADPARRSARLATLARVRDAVHAVADFSRIEG